jgi:dienelactone hydrolase
MFEYTKATARRFGTRASFALNAVILILAATASLAVHTGHAKADIELVGWSVGGGTSQHVGREQQLAALSAAVPASAVTPPPAKVPAVADPMPGRKPVVR